VSYDPRELKRRIIVEIVGSPTVIYPALLGITVGGLSLLWSGPALLSITGCAILLAGGGVGVTKLINSKDLSENIQEKIIREEEKKQEFNLNALEGKLVDDGDARTHTALSDLRALLKILKESELSLSIAGREMIILDVEALFDASVNALAKTLELKDAIDGLTTKGKAKKALKDQRESMISDVLQSVERIGEIVADMQKLGASGEMENHNELRAELQSKLDIAKSVENQMRQWSKGDYSQYDEHLTDSEQGEQHVPQTR